MKVPSSASTFARTDANRSRAANKRTECRTDQESVTKFPVREAQNCRSGRRRWPLAAIRHDQMSRGVTESLNSSRVGQIGPCQSTAQCNLERANTNKKEGRYSL